MTTFRYLVAGASSGIGLELTRQLLAEGHHVIALGRRTPPLNAPGLTFVEHDFRSESPLPAIEGAVDGLAYCPGSITLKPLAMLKDADLMDDFRLNALGAFQMVKAYKAQLVSGQQPGVVFFSSVAVQTGMPFHTSVSMSKGAVEGLTRALAAELAPTVRVNCIAPSLTDTPLAGTLLNNETKRTANAERHPLKRVGEAAEIARMARFLLQEATWMTGQVIGLNGGMGSVIK
ncbi:MAG TPA: SDR family oxidoreductase [Flavobacterium sp.]|nr:SDR family oxidoreductase [Flavobacterium sp.]